MKIPQNAVDVAGYAIGTDYRSSLTFPREVAEVALSAALPHIRRAVIEELVEKAKAEAAGQYDPYRIRSVEANYALGWLRDELDEGDGE